MATRSKDDPGLASFAAMLDGVFGEECVEENPVKREQAKYPSQSAEAKRAWRARKKEEAKRVRTPAQKARRAAYNRKRRAGLQGRGICTDCGHRPIDKDRSDVRCGECLDRVGDAVARSVAKRRPAPPVEEPLTDGERAALAAENAKRGWG